MPDTTVRIQKLDAAKRQLRTAIMFWFADGDPVAIHTLAAASHEIIHTLFRRSGLRGLLFDSPLIREEYRSEFAKRMKAQATFFKHAQRDPNGEISFDPSLNQNLLLTTVFGLSKMKELLETPEFALVIWFRIHAPAHFQGDVAIESLSPEILDSLRQIPKHAFFEACKEVFPEPRGVPM